MLEIINILKPFFEDCYREISVREYSREMKISPPTASKMLKEYEKEGLLNMREERRYILFRANRESKVLMDLSRVYWSTRLKVVVEYLNKELNYPTIILFGSLIKLETKSDSDIDIAIIGSDKEKSLKSFEKNLKREIQILYFRSFRAIKNEELLKNIINGYVLSGRIEL